MISENAEKDQLLLRAKERAELSSAASREEVSSPAQEMLLEDQNLKASLRELQKELTGG